MDFLDSLREQALIQTTAYQQRVAKYYNSRVKTKAFQVGNLVLRESKVSQPTKVDKLSPKWEGPYIIIRVIRPGAYQLQRPDGSFVPWSWNAEHLRKYYQ